MVKVWRNEAIPEYSQYVIWYRRQYEYELGDDISQDSPRDKINREAGIASGRGFSQYLIYRGWTIKEVAVLNLMRFDDGENRIVGRDFITFYGYSSDLALEIVQTAMKQIDWYTTTIEVKNIVAWITGSGKRTRYGKPSNGEVVVRRKVHYKNQGKRNRKTLGF